MALDCGLLAIKKTVSDITLTVKYSVLPMEWTSRHQYG
uniref:Uncharacterized protein n=1 Tax=Rhizophora mucronata TaxID=61149 RepID=A0A2P2KPH3_RHIMU